MCIVNWSGEKYNRIYLRHNGTTMNKMKMKTKTRRRSRKTKWENESIENRKREQNSSVNRAMAHEHKNWSMCIATKCESVNRCLEFFMQSYIRLFCRFFSSFSVFWFLFSFNPFSVVLFRILPGVCSRVLLMARCVYCRGKMLFVRLFVSVRIVDIVLLIAAQTFFI